MSAKCSRHGSMITSGSYSNSLTLTGEWSVSMTVILDYITMVTSFSLVRFSKYLKRRHHNFNGYLSDGVATSNDIAMNSTATKFTVIVTILLTCLQRPRPTRLTNNYYQHVIRFLSKYPSKRSHQNYQVG